MTTTASVRPLARSLPDGSWIVDPATSEVRFSLRHFRVQTVRGTLEGLEGTVEVVAGQLTARGSVDAASISTQAPPRDAHLRSFLFATKRYPRIELRADGPFADQLPVTLWIRGRPSTVLATLDGEASALRVSFSLDRRAAGLTWPAPIEVGGIAVGRHVDVELLLALRSA